MILNAATSTVGQAVIQLCATLQLRSVAVANDHGNLDKTALWLKSLGATQVLRDNGSIKASKLLSNLAPLTGFDDSNLLKVEE